MLGYLCLVELTDLHRRTHRSLRISIVDKCDLRCTYCMPEEQHFLPREKLMTREEIRALATLFTELYGITKIRLTGGEPLVRPDVVDIVQDLAALPVKLGLSTNGTRLHLFLDRLVDAGLKHLNISLDTFDAERFKQLSRRDGHAQVLANIQQAIDRGLHVKVNMVVMRGINDDEVTDFMEWSRAERVHVRFIEYMPFNGNRWEWGKGVSEAEIMARATERFGASGYERLTDRPNDTARNYRLRDASGTFAIISSVTNPFCGTCNRIRLTADGKLKNCLFGQHETDLLGALRQGEDIRPLIISSVLHKKAMRGGMDSFEKFSDPARHGANRSMVAIGG